MLGAGYRLIISLNLTPVACTGRFLLRQENREYDLQAPNAIGRYTKTEDG